MLRTMGMEDPKLKKQREQASSQNNQNTMTPIDSPPANSDHPETGNQSAPTEVAAPVRAGPLVEVEPDQHRGVAGEAGVLVAGAGEAQLQVQGEAAGGLQHVEADARR